MNDRIDHDLMSQFTVEVDQHLAAIEPILVAADFETPKRSDMDLMFRGFHSIKGLARMIEANAMEALAHEAENLLSRVRSGARGFDATVQEPLIAAIDGLKDALAEPLAAPAPAAIIGALRRATATTGPKPSRDAPADISGSEPWRFLGDDLDLLRAFAELLCEILPEAAQAVVEGDDNAFGEAIGTVTHACTRLGLDGVKAIADRVAVQSGAERLYAFGKLLRKAARFGTLVGEDCGVTAAVELINDLLRALRERLIDDALMAQPDERAARVRYRIRQCDFTAAGRLVADIVQRPPSTVAFSGDLDPLLRQALAVLKRGLDDGDDPDGSVASLRDALSAPYAAGEEIEAHLRRLGLDTSLFSPGPPRRLERLSTLLDGSGATMKELIIETPSAAAPASLAQLDPLLGQSGGRGGRPVLALLLLDAEETDAVADRARQLLGDLVGEVRRLDPGRAGGEFSPDPGSAAGRTEQAEDAQVRVPVEVLDKLFGRIGEFFSIGSRLNVLATESDVPYALRQLSDFAVTRAPGLQADIDILVRQHRDFCAVEVDVARVISLIHESTLGLRVIPLDTLVARFPRMVRQTARGHGKQVRFLAETGGIRIDKGMADMLADPLTHMLRNAIDHGIETEAERLAQGKSRTATLRLNAHQQANRIVMEVSDDGRGIDLEHVKRRVISTRLASRDEIDHMSDEQLARFIFTPGFSTAAKVSEISGRGVGMDIVLVNVTKLGGKIDIATEAGRGTTFRLDLPLSAAIQPMLLADTGVQLIGFPEAMVSEALVFPSSGVQHVNGQRSILLRERFLPLFKVTELLRLPHPPAENRADLPIVLCEWTGQRMGVEVHRILRRGEMLIRETHPRVAALPGIGGISTMGFDRIVLVLDPDEMFDLARKASVFGLRVPAERLALEQDGAA